MKPAYKVTSAFLALAFFFACNFCAVECAFASPQNGGTAACHQGSDSHETGGDRTDSPPGKHDAGSKCCPSLITVKNVSNDFVFSKLHKNPPLNSAPDKATFTPEVYFWYEIEFPPGASPPSLFLLSHFSHAPPSIL
jgi:hypothetical protein